MVEPKTHIVYRHGGTECNQANWRVAVSPGSNLYKVPNLCLACSIIVGLRIPWKTRSWRGNV